MNNINVTRIGILGCASIAKKSVIPAIKALPNLFELKYVCSRYKQKAEDFASEFSCTPITGYKNLIDRDDIDALYIPLPTGLHSEYINYALESRKHVYAEKSIALCYNDSKIMVKNAKKNDLALMEGYMFCYHNQHKLVLNLLKENRIGEIRHFFSCFGFPPLNENNFRYRMEP